MQQLLTKAKRLLAAVPPGQRVTAIAGFAGLALAGVIFLRWVSAPSYTVLYTNLDDKRLSRVIGALDGQGVPYKIEAGGSRVLVPRGDVYKIRAGLAEEGIAERTVPQGYELLDAQGLAVSDFKQRVDYQRALEGELAKTLMAMDGVNEASVHLALPDDSNPFDARPQEVSASVLVDSSRQLSQSQIETVVFLVSSAVEGLEPGKVTVADSTGRVLAAPGSVGGDGVSGDRNLRMTREYETALTSDIQRLLSTMGGGKNASVVVRAQLDFDERSIEREAFDSQAPVTLRERSSSERLNGSPQNTGGLTGVAGITQNQLRTATGNGVDYTKEDSSRDYGVSRQVTRTRQAPGRIERLSIAIVMDDGAKAKTKVASTREIEELVSRAVGLDASRGDTIKVSQVPLQLQEATSAKSAANPLFEMVPKAAGALVVLLVGVVLFLMAMRGRGQSSSLPAAELVWTPPIEAALAETRAMPAMDLGALRGGPEPRDVRDLVERQPEEIAAMLRSWLSDRRR